MFNLPEMTEERRIGALFFSLNFFMYVCVALFWPYMSAHYANLGIDSGRIGILTSIASLATLFVLPFWSRISDRTGNRRAVLKIIALGSSLSILLFLISNSFWTLLLTVSLFMCFHVCLIPLTDAVVITYLAQTRMKFSSIRLGGTIGFGLMMLVSGYIYAYSSILTFSLASACFLLLFLFIRKIPQVEVEKKEKQRFELRRLFKNKRIIFILFIAFVIQVAQGFNFAFLGVYIQELGFTSREIGIAHFLSVLLEIPVFLVIDRVLRRFSVITVTIFCGFIITLRMLMLFAAADMSLIYMSMLSNGISFIGVYYSCATFINREMDSDLKSTGQSMLAICQMGLGNITGSLLGGYISMYAGIRYAYLCFGLTLGIVCVICTAAFTALKIKRRYQ